MEWNGGRRGQTASLSLSLLILLHCTLKGTPRRAALSHLVAHLFNGILTDRNLSRCLFCLDFVSTSRV